MWFIEHLPARKVNITKVFTLECQAILKTSEAKVLLNTAYSDNIQHFIIVYFIIFPLIETAPLPSVCMKLISVKRAVESVYLFAGGPDLNVFSTRLYVIVFACTGHLCTFGIDVSRETF